MRNVSDESCKKYQNLHFMINNFFRKLCHLWDNVEKYSKAGQAIDDNVAHVHCMLDTWGYEHILRVCKTYCLSTTTMVSWTPHNVTLYINRLSCLLQLESVKNYVVLHHTIPHLPSNCKSFPLGKIILLITLFSNTFIQCSALTETDKILDYTQ
jgi:hypothetical protein